jgi:hypothetical protein
MDPKAQADHTTPPYSARDYSSYAPETIEYMYRPFPHPNVPGFKPMPVEATLIVAEFMRSHSALDWENDMKIGKSLKMAFDISYIAPELKGHLVRGSRKRRPGGT